MSILSFLGPQQVTVNQPTVLAGTFDSRIVSSISVLVDNQYPLQVELNAPSGLWYISLEQGLNQPGTRSLRLQGRDKTGKVVSDQTIKLTVSATATVSAQPISLFILQDTFLKVGTGDSSALSDQQKVKLPAGQMYPIKTWEFANTHLKVELANPLFPVGSIGYVYEPHIILIKGAKILRFEPADLSPAPPGSQLLWIQHNTKLKLYPEDSANLAPNQQVELSQGETFIILGYAAVEEHFRVTFAQDIPDFGNSGYLYWRHVVLWQGDKPILFDQNAITFTVLKTTPFKKRPIDAAKLKPEETTTLPAGMIYGVASYSLEAGHIKVSLTENLPQFGNTGYLYPDFVQFSRGGKLFNLLPFITYTGPREVLVNQATVLTGSFNRESIAKVAVVAEDKYPLNVTLNQTTGTWQVNLPKGFSAAGARWLRLKATNAAGGVVGSQIVYINVSSDPLTVGESLNLKILEDTLFKVAPVDSSRLNQQQKVLVKAGQTFSVSKYGLIDGHLKVLLDSTISPIGTFGYFYQRHVELTKGTKTLRFDLEDLPETHLSAQLLVTQTTVIKARPEDSAAAGNATADLILGSTFAITGYACVAGHFRVTLAESIPNFGTVGYIYWQHVKIVRNGKEILYDPDAMTMTISQTTVLKKRPVDATNLNDSEKATLPLGRVYGVDSYGVEDTHLRVALTEELANFGNTGYVYPNYVRFRRGNQTFNPIPNTVELNIPYFSQRDNPRFYWSTCNVTSIAMAFYYYGVRAKWSSQLEDELLQWCFNYAGTGSQTDHTVLSALIRAYNFKTSFSTTRRWSQIKSELINRRPVILAGNFTASGHILTVMGYNPSGYLVQDPWGDALTGYSNTEGRRLLYPYGYMEQVAGPDGNIWAHFISR